MEFEQILNVLSSGNGQTAQCTMNFRHVRRKPLAIQFLLSSAIDFGDQTCLAQFFDPPSNRFMRNVLKFVFVEGVVEIPVQAPTMTHQPLQLLGVGGDRCFV